MDREGRRVEYRLFFYDALQRDFDRTIDYLKEHASRNDVVAAGTPHWIYLRTGLTTVMPPLEQDAEAAQRLLDSVPVSYLIIGHDVVGSEVYAEPVVRRHPDKWTRIYSTPNGDWAVYRRAAAGRLASLSKEQASTQRQ